MVKVRKGWVRLVGSVTWWFTETRDESMPQTVRPALLIDLPSGDVMDGFEDWFAAEIKGWFGPTDFEDELSDTHASAKAGWFAARGGG